jgi:hypothetical protein
VPEDMPVREKYSTRAAKWYRENLRAEAEESEPPAPLPPGIGHLPAHDSPNSTHKVLDQVFAKAPCSGSMTAGGVQNKQRRPKLSPKADSKGLWDRLGATVEQALQRRASVSAPAALGRANKIDDTRIEQGASAKSSMVRQAERRRVRTLSPTPHDQRNRCLAPDLSFEWLLPRVPLPTLLGRSGLQNAERLQTLSSGKMEGFGCDTCPSKPVAMAEVDSLAATAA